MIMRGTVLPVAFTDDDGDMPLGKASCSLDPRDRFQHSFRMMGTRHMPKAHPPHSLADTVWRFRSTRPLPSRSRTLPRHFAASVALLFLMFNLVACDTPNPDYRIKISTTPEGQMVATPPACPSWHDIANAATDNAPWPQFGCATARNLASAVEDPQDLVQPKTLDPANGAVMASGMNRYLTGQTKALIDPNAAGPVAAASSGSSTGGQ